MTDAATNNPHGLQMGRVLIVAGSDSSGGAGIQADIKTVTMLGHYASTAVTAITVQNTLGVSDVLALEPPLVKAQMKAVLSDVGADVVKTGMLHSVEIMEAVVSALDAVAFKGPVVVDPVMAATSGDALIKNDALSGMRSLLLTRAALVTPNIPEAQLLTGMLITTVDEMKHAAEKLFKLGAKAVLLKGGHLDSATLTDLLLTPVGFTVLTAPKQNTRHTHGTGCTMASALAALLSGGATLEDAFRGAHAFVQDTIARAPGFGAGHGPLGHAHARKDARW